MPPFGVEFEQTLGNGPMTITDLESLFRRMGLATLLAACVSYRGWRPLIPFTSPPSAHAAQAQTLIAAAGCSMVVVIGDNVARAFGLVGLGSVTRFRSLISDSRDAAVMFVMSGIGMACGLGRSVMAIAGTAFVSLLLIKLFKNTRVVEMSNRVIELGKDSGELVVERDLRGNLDAATIREVLETNQVPGVYRVALAE